MDPDAAGKAAGERILTGTWKRKTDLDPPGPVGSLNDGPFISDPGRRDPVLDLSLAGGAESGGRNRRRCSRAGSASGWGGRLREAGDGTLRAKPPGGKDPRT
jgi:hypothetical protein